ncbi:Zinc finger BED domain-containing protein 4 [Labeo rohita]|uniref:Zinc finger BED domain-containing protein 4 n=1 Tax=Labeo rohita TaxID=84645 RepID=A0ABQ8LCV0_LABRO|nr:Zinc finger BED domain-containing protein 4 [Labeo rohita]
MSFTTDIWSSDVSPTKFTGSHTSLAISQAFTDMLDRWKIDRSRVHTVVRDNARNLAKAVTDSNIMSLPCMAHSLQLASIQSQMGLPLKRFKQDVNTRWNSTFYMMESLVEWKPALTAYPADYELPVTLTAQQWTLMESVTTLEQITREISKEDASAADIIPLFETLKRVLSKETDSDHGVKTTTTTKKHYWRQYKSSSGTPLPTICAVSQRSSIRDAMFFDADTKRQTHEMLVGEITKVDTLETEIYHSTKEGSTTSFSAMFSEIVEENGTVTDSASVSAQVSSYLAEPVIPRHESALTYWAANQCRLPVLAQVARKYLSAPCTSVDSERTFSAASNVINEKRNGLSCD